MRGIRETFTFVYACNHRLNNLDFNKQDIISFRVAIQKNARSVEDSKRINGSDI